MPQAHSSFTLDSFEQAPLDETGEVQLGSATFHKTFTGDIAATSVVHMLSAGRSDAPLAYIALELVTGSLHGSVGTFVLRHEGSMAAGAAVNELEVVPGSGTGELKDITGTAVITHNGGGQQLAMTYELP